MPGFLNEGHMNSKILQTIKDRSTVIAMRLTLFAFIFLFMAYGKKSAAASPGILIAILGFFLLLVAVQFFVSDKLFRSNIYQASIFISEVALLSLTIYLTQEFNGDLYLVYFLTILMAGFTRQVWHVVAVALSSSVFYGLLLAISDHGVNLLDPALLLRIPFLVLVAIFVSFYAITVQMKSVQLETAKNEITQFKERLSMAEKLTIIGQVMAGVAHELNNPLTGIMGYSQLLLRDDAVQDNPPLRDNLERIFKESQRCQKIVKDLSTFARRHKPEKSYVGVNGLIEDCLRLEAYQFVTRNIQYGKELDPNLPKTMADYHQLQQVIMNLLINAQQAMTDAHGKGNLTVRTKTRGDKIRVEIEDDGPGIHPDNVAKIFEPFFTTKPVGQGTGLGLSLSYGIVKEHGGEIWAENASGKGALFVMELPVVEDTAGVVPAPPPKIVEVPGGKRILVIDDEPVVQDFLFRLIKKLGHRPDIAIDGVSGFDKLKKNDYDVILCDLRIPGQNGLQLFDWVTEHKPQFVARWVFITGSIGEEHQGKMREKGRPIIQKPFRIEDIENLLKQMLTASSG